MERPAHDCVSLQTDCRVMPDGLAIHSVARKYPLAGHRPTNQSKTDGRALPNGEIIAKIGSIGKYCPGMELAYIDKKQRNASGLSKAKFPDLASQLT